MITIKFSNEEERVKFNARFGTEFKNNEKVPEDQILGADQFGEKNIIDVVNFYNNEIGGDIKYETD